MTKYERVPDSQMRAGDLVAGSRGRELCGRHQVPEYLVPAGRVPAMSFGCLRRRKMRRTNSKDGHNGGF